MSDAALFTTVALAHLLAVMSPGPDFAVVARQTLAHGRSAGLWTAWGIGSGILFHVGYGLFGLAWLTERLPWLLDGLRWGGALFLLWLGLHALRSRPSSVSSPAPQQATPSARRSYAIGLLTNCLNPKATLFFVALFASVITTETAYGLRWALGGWVVLSTAAWFSLVATLLSSSRLSRRLQGHAHRIDQAMGGMLVLLALIMLLR